jgi:fatty-acid desaturase
LPPCPLPRLGRFSDDRSKEVVLFSAWLWSLIPTFLLAVPTTTVYLHRTVTHRALTLHPVAEWSFKFVNWLTTGVDPAVWAAVHRKHHAYSDVEVAPDKRDPHSPWLEGFWHIQLGNVSYYLAELRKHPDTLTTFAGDILIGWWRCPPPARGSTTIITTSSQPPHSRGNNGN